MSAFPEAPDLQSTLDQAVLERRSIRSFQDEPVAPDLIVELLERSRWAPSPHNSQPWRFTVLSDATDKDRLAASMADQLAQELRADGLDEESIHRQTGRSRERIVSAPVVVVCSLQGDGLVPYSDPRRNELEWQMAVQSVGAVLQTLFLLAWERGLGSCWMAAPMYCPEIVRAALDLPDDLAPQALALLGYPAQSGKVRERRPIEEVVDLR